MSGHISERVNRQELRILTENEVRRLVTEYEVIEENFDLSHYIPPGPVSREFITSPSLTAIIMGPLGGGKTTACVFKRIYAATLAPVARHPEDGKLTRMCRWIVMRDTFRQVEKSVLESWRLWFPKTYPGSTWRGGGDRPGTHTLRFMGADGIRIEAITEFAGLGDQAIGETMKGTEYSGAWLNEFDTHAEGALDDVEQRLGRYPSQELLVNPDDERRRFAIGDMNAPTIDNWSYPVCVTELKPGRKFFQQPSGRSTEAENRGNLPPDYYSRIIENQDERFVRRMVDNEFGYSMAGKPVHPTFNHRRHVARTSIPFDPKLDLLIGVDISTNALTPAAVFAQNDTRRIKIIGEAWPGQGFGPVRFAEVLKTALNERFQNARRVRLWCDPAAQYGGDKEGGQQAAMQILQASLGIPILIPFDGSNELSLRLETVNLELRGNLDPDSWLLISPDCPLLIEAFGGRYRFKKLSAQATNDFDDRPEKNHPYSDLADATQYLIGGVRGRAGIIANASGTKTGLGGGWGGNIKDGFDPRNVGL